jgi:hypothetical protein
MNAVGDFEREKWVVADAAADIVESRMIVGLDTGSTVAYLLPALAARRLDVPCVTSSSAIERVARDLGIEVEPFSGPDAPERRRPDDRRRCVALEHDGRGRARPVRAHPRVRHTGGSGRPRRSDHDAATRR